MPFIGNQPANAFTSFAKQDFTTSATTSYSLDYPVTNANELALFINFVRQEPTTAYSASGTTLTLTSATSATDDMYCVFLGKALQTVNPADGSVGTSQLSATGTKDGTTFLRGDNTFASAQGAYESALLHVRDEKGVSVHGGTSQTSYTARDLNTVVTNEIAGASLSSNQITLPSGTYYINASAPAYASDRSTAKLRNTTDSTDIILGTSTVSNGGSASTNTEIIGRFTIASSKVFEIQHRTQTSTATLGLGVSKDMSETNIYTNVQIWKVA